MTQFILVVRKDTSKLREVMGIQKMTGYLFKRCAVTVLELHFIALSMSPTADLCFRLECLPDT